MRGGATGRVRQTADEADSLIRPRVLWWGGFSGTASTLQFVGLVYKVYLFSRRGSRRIGTNK